MFRKRIGVINVWSMRHKQNETKSREHCKRSSMRMKKIRPKHKTEKQWTKPRPSFALIYRMSLHVHERTFILFFYKKKIKVYNLTTHCSLDRKAYNAIWTENIADRGASALLVILSAILKDQTSINTIIRWFDSCIPHNRISVMTLVLKIFISRNPYTIKEEQTFWTPGHPFIQDADNIHSHLDVGLRIYDIYNPVSCNECLNIMSKHS